MEETCLIKEYFENLAVRYLRSQIEKEKGRIKIKKSLEISVKQIIILFINKAFLDSSAAEHSAVNRRVVGSNPTRGVKIRLVNIVFTGLFVIYHLCK